MLKPMLLALLFLVSGNALAEARQEEFKEGMDYEAISPPQPTSDPSKIEVMEFFWYGCPHCLHFEPTLNAWVKKKPASVSFIRQPAIFNERWAAHAKAFFTADVLGVEEKMHADFFDAIQNKKRSLESEDDLARFFAEHGVAEKDFHAAYKSFAVDARMRQGEPLAAKYGVTGTPTMTIDGKYRISPGQAKSFDRMIVITEALVSKEQARK